MKKWLIGAATIALLVVGGAYIYRTVPKQDKQVSEFVIISTNDVHGSLVDMPRLATAVKECRDTLFTIVVDAGDRWTGNAYVDLAEGRLPMIDLMNAVGYEPRCLTVQFITQSSILCAPI